jgi:hypothetical protein
MALNEALAGWASGNPRIARLWLLNNLARGNGAIDVQLELRPVSDSEETLAVWLANRENWRRQLQTLVGLSVALECRDPDDAVWTREPGPGEARTLVYERLS